MISREGPDQAEVAGLLAAADARSAALYPAESRFGLTVAALIRAEARFFVARDGGLAVGCGGYVRLSAEAAELKRLFVTPMARGRGVGRMLVMAAEGAAAAEGVRALLLETGVKSASALGLYRRLGFVECAPFAPYQDDPLSVFLVKRLS